MAKKTGKLYEVVRLTSADFFNWNNVSSSLFLNRSRTDMGDIINWTKIKWLQFHSGSGNVKYEIDNSDFMPVAVKSTRRRNRNDKGIMEFNDAFVQCSTAYFEGKVSRPTEFVSH